MVMRRSGKFCAPTDEVSADNTTTRARRRLARVISTLIICAGVSPTILGLIGHRDALLVEAALVHRVNLAHENMCCHLVLGAAEFAERRQQNQVIERLFRQRQAERPGLRAVFRSSHFTPHSYNAIIMAL